MDHIIIEKKYVNMETPRAISGLVCYKCKSPVTDLRSFKCHNWAYAIGKLRALLETISEDTQL